MQPPPVHGRFCDAMRARLTGSWRAATRRPMRAQRFIDTDFFKNQVVRRLPAAVGQSPVADVSGLDARAVGAVGGERTVAEVLRMRLDAFTRETGLSVAEAISVRRTMLGLAPRDDGAPGKAPR